jgi:hypothetical protein
MWLGIQHANYNFINNVWSQWFLIMELQVYNQELPFDIKNQVLIHNHKNSIIIKRLLVSGSTLDWFENHKGLRTYNLKLIPNFYGNLIVWLKELKSEWHVIQF